LGHTGDITYLTDVNVDYLHQPWRAFATVINKFLNGKETGIDKIHLLFQIENKDAKKTKAKGLTILSEQKKSSGTDEGTGSIPGVPDVPIYESKSEKESWGDSEDEDEETILMI
ncbi:hypothetical protein Tco_0220968, partial [Tanacetum coccineum]